MPVPISYPGVYVTEIPGGSRTVVGVATSITAFVGAASRGPADVPVTIFSFTDFERTFGGLWRSSGLGYAVRDFYQNGGGEALIVRLVHGAVSATLELDGLKLEAIGPGAWGNALQVEVSHPADDDPDAIDVAAGQGQGITVGDLCSLVVREGDPDGGGLEETYFNVTVADGPARVSAVLSTSRLVRVSEPDTDLPTSRPAVTGDGDPAKFAGGDDGGPLEEADYLPLADSASPGINALLQADLFNLLCIPPPTPESDVTDQVWRAAKSLCFRQRAFLIVDPPRISDLTSVQSVATAMAGQDARNAALYFPRIRVSDPLRGGAIGEFAACGAIAGVYARTDGSRGVWKAPAGVDAALSGVAGLASTLTDDENGLLNPKGINVLRTFRGTGSVVWGARTMRGSDSLADEYKYVPVRRLALFLEETLYRSTQWVVFEPNDGPLWAQIRASLNAFMQDMFRRGAFQGATPREAFFVRCDADTTNQYDIDRGIVNILVGFAPLKPAEFVVISIQQQTASASA
jgi:phage tail sheath protein FI